MEKANAERLLETEIKSLVLTHLITKGILTSTDTIFNEFTVDNASRRVDLAITKGNELWAFEIKSEADTLVRLKGQIETYSKYFDKVFVIVASKHTESALKFVSKSIALWEINGKELIIKQKGQKKLIRNPSSFIDMMNIPDLVKVANNNGLKLKSKRREDLVNVLIKINASILRKAALKAIINKYHFSSKVFFDRVIDRTITSDDISLLSRFKIQNKKSLIEADNIDDIINSINKIVFDQHSVVNKKNFELSRI
ncbi:MAG: sce7726 family protein [Candidatus Oceanisphaera merdipullorum]|nr:sce7726 family protein [Candidatus Oceanisphaera merdipullorum]